MVDLITTATYAAVGTLRDVHDAVEDADPSTADLLHQTIDGLEKLAWLIKSENRKVWPDQPGGHRYRAGIPTPSA